VAFHTAGAISLITGFTNGQGQIWLSDVQCDGTETRLIDCVSNPLGVHNCHHYEDAGVSCPICTTGAIRLQGGNATTGRVEICNNAVWGTVCDDLWGTQDAQVACRQLGYEPTGSFEHF
jgi:deleted-in-malignant-brain-tumors protein 1